VLIAFLVTTTGLRVGLGPLRRVTRTAQEVTSELSPSGGGLDRRVPATGSTTEVGQLASSFNTMLDRVEDEFAARRESEERMRRFLADASHELRTPLTSIRGYAELARLERARTGAAQSDDTLGRIETEGTRMSRLVEDLLLLARGDDAREEPGRSADHTPVDVADLVDEVTASVRAAFPQRVIDVDVSTEPMTVLGDRDQLVRVLRNLVVNACVHTDPSGPVTVSAHRHDDRVELTVADHGPGLSPDEAAHVFDRFWRADRARSRARGGSGLGMAIVAQIVAAHQGDVRFDSSVEHGSRVAVTLPAAG
jgi:two-component system, OmpR family, sensor kinase